MEAGSPKGELSHMYHQLGHNYNRKIGLREKGRGYDLRSLGGEGHRFWNNAGSI